MKHLRFAVNEIDLKAIVKIGDGYHFQVIVVQNVWGKVAGDAPKAGVFVDKVIDFGKAGLRLEKMGRNLKGGALLFKQVVQLTAVVNDAERDILQRLDGNAFLLGQGVAFWDDKPQVEGAQVVFAEFFAVDGLKRQGDVAGTFANHPVRINGPAGNAFHRAAIPGGMDALQKGKRQGGIAVPGNGHANGVGFVGRMLKIILYLLKLRDQVAGVIIELFARFGDLDVVFSAYEKTGVELLLQLGDGGAEPLLGNKQIFGCFCKVKLLINLHKVDQLFYVHTHISQVFYNKFYL